MDNPALYPQWPVPSTGAGAVSSRTCYGTSRLLLHTPSSGLLCTHGFPSCFCAVRGNPCPQSHISWLDWASADSPQGLASILFLSSIVLSQTEPPTDSRWAQAESAWFHSVQEHSTKPITFPAPDRMLEIQNESCI